MLAEHTGLSRVTINALENWRASVNGMRKGHKIVAYLGYELQLKGKRYFKHLRGYVVGSCYASWQFPLLSGVRPKVLFQVETKLHLNWMITS